MKNLSTLSHALLGSLLISNYLPYNNLTLLAFGLFTILSITTVGYVSFKDFDEVDKIKAKLISKGVLMFWFYLIVFSIVLGIVIGILAVISGIPSLMNMPVSSILKTSAQIGIIIGSCYYVFNYIKFHTWKDNTEYSFDHTGFTYACILVNPLWIVGVINNIFFNKDENEISCAHKKWQNKSILVAFIAGFVIGILLIAGFIIMAASGINPQDTIREALTKNNSTEALFIFAAATIIAVCAGVWYIYRVVRGLVTYINGIKPKENY